MSGQWNQQQMFQDWHNSYKIWPQFELTLDEKTDLPKFAS